MKEWVKEPFSKDFRSVDAVMLHLLTLADKYQFTLPPYRHSHVNCVKAASAALRNILESDEQPSMDLMASLSIVCAEHVNTLRSIPEPDRSWECFYERQIWETLTHTTMAILSVMGEGFGVAQDHGIVMRNGKEGFTFGFTRALGSVMILRTAAEEPEKLHLGGKGFREFSTQELTQRMVGEAVRARLWIVSILDFQCDQGLPLPSTLYPMPLNERLEKPGSHA